MPTVFQVDIGWFDEYPMYRGRYWWWDDVVEYVPPLASRVDTFWQRVRAKSNVEAMRV